MHLATPRHSLKNSQPGPHLLFAENGDEYTGKISDFVCGSKKVSILISYVWKSHINTMHTLKVDSGIF